LPGKEISVGVGWYFEQTRPELTRQRVKADSKSVDEDGNPPVPMLEIEGVGPTRLLRLDSPRQLRRGLFEWAGRYPMPCNYVGPFSASQTNQLASLADVVVENDAEKQVVAALQIISPDIEGFRMIGNESASRPRTAKVKISSIHRLLPMKTLGDGVNRLFGIILNLSCAQGGVLLVDEIENGLHHSIFAKVWEVVFQMARTLNVQVFATTHSWNCIEAFQQAAPKESGEGVLVRLTAKGGDVLPTLFDSDELRIAARDQIEVR
jgi:hypothetical protein